MFFVKQRRTKVRKMEMQKSFSEGGREIDSIHSDPFGNFPLVLPPPPSVENFANTRHVSRIDIPFPWKGENWPFRGGRRARARARARASGGVARVSVSTPLRNAGPGPL